jgi:hypothetical protein
MWIKFLLISICVLSARAEEISNNLEVISYDAPADTACNLKVQFENHPNSVFSTSDSNVDKQLDVYVGNGFFYDIGCQITDPKMKPNDRYYVIDLVIYGPNSRVAKAWREQFNTATLLKSSSRLLSLSKKASFHWIGVNSIVCSVSKYNNVVNKFTRLCQKTMRINATEKTSDLKAMQPMSYLDLLFTSRLNRTQVPIQNSQLEELEKLILKQKLVWSSNFSIDSSQVNSTVPELSSTTTEDSDMDYETRNTNSSEEVSLSAKAMQFRNAQEFNKKNLITDASSSKVNPSARTSSIMQPLLIILVFFIIFSISIGTIAYLTYHQKSTISDDYSSVKQHDAEDPTSSADMSQATSTANSMSRKFKLTATPSGTTTNNQSLCSASQLSSTFSASDCNETNKLNNSNEEDEINDLKINHKK